MNVSNAKHKKYCSPTNISTNRQSISEGYLCALSCQKMKDQRPKVIENLLMAWDQSDYLDSNTLTILKITEKYKKSERKLLIIGLSRSSMVRYYYTKIAKYPYKHATGKDQFCIEKGK